MDKEQTMYEKTHLNIDMHIEGNIARPVVLGSLYDQSTIDSHEQIQNHLKSLTTRSGHLIEFDDDEGSQGIKVTDIKGNILHIDSVGDNVTLTALNNMTLNCKNMQINVSENMEMQVGKSQRLHIAQNQSCEVGETVSLEARNVTQQIANDVKIQVANKKEIIAGEIETTAIKGSIDTQSIQGDITLVSGGRALLQGASDARISKA